MFLTGSIPSHEIPRVSGDCELLDPCLVLTSRVLGSTGAVRTLLTPELYFRPRPVYWAPDPYMQWLGIIISVMSNPTHSQPVTLFLKTWPFPSIPCSYVVDTPIVQLHEPETWSHPPSLLPHSPVFKPTTKSWHFHLPVLSPPSLIWAKKPFTWIRISSFLAAGAYPILFICFFFIHRSWFCQGCSCPKNYIS